MITVTKRDLIELGYGPSFAADIIKKAKELMVEKGHTYYQSRKLDRQATVPFILMLIPSRNYKNGRRSRQRFYQIVDSY